MSFPTNGATKRPWKLFQPVNNAANGTLVKDSVKGGGGVVYGINAINNGASALYLLFLNPSTPTSTVTYSGLIKAYLIPASGALIINPLEGGGLFECPDNLVFAVSSTLGSFTNSTGGANVGLDFV